MSQYNVKFTDSGKGEIIVPEAGMNRELDVILPGRVRLEWGEEINEAFLNLLENFACPEDPQNPGTPDLSAASIVPGTHNPLRVKLDAPVQGQLWFNKTDERLYNWTGVRWEPYTLNTQDFAANWGQVNHGETLPNPVTPDGYVFPYSECIWSVSPFQYPQRFKNMTCRTDLQTSEVTMQYSFLNGTAVDGIANYLIIGIRGNNNDEGVDAVI